MTVILSFRTLKQDDNKFEATMDCTGSSRPALGYIVRSCLTEPKPSYVIIIIILILL